MFRFFDFNIAFQLRTGGTFPARFGSIFDCVIGEQFSDASDFYIPVNRNPKKSPNVSRLGWESWQCGRWLSRGEARRMHNFER